MALSLTEGWTEPIGYRLTKRKRNSTVASGRDLTGHTVNIIATSDSGTVYFNRSVTLDNAINGEILYSPQSGDIVKANSPMNIKFKVTDPGGKISYHPMGKGERWEIS